METTIGFIGTGQMATALATGFIRTEKVSVSELFGYDVFDDAAIRFAKATGGSCVSSIKELVSRANVVFLAVKPQQMGAVLKELKTICPEMSKPLWISIAAGITMSNYLDAFGMSARIVRVMPNTPALVGEGVSGFCVSEAVTPADVELAESLLSSVGSAFRVPESQLDAVVGVSGSGPAYVYMMIESLADGGVKMGLPRDLALKLAAQTVVGAGRMVVETGEHPAVLKDKVCSPKGTTICAVHVLEQNGFRAAVIEAVEAATKRSLELASEK